MLTVVPSSRRCAATNLPKGDCQMQKLNDSAYCFYHDKLQRGVAEPHVDSVRVQVETFDDHGKRRVRTETQSVVRTDCYPVWPLPKAGYVLLGGHPLSQAA